MAAPTHQLVVKTLQAFTHVEWGLLALGSLAASWAFIFVEGFLGVPREPYFSGSFFCGGTAVSSLIGAVVAIPIGLALATLIAGSVEVEAALFCCCMGLVGLAIQCGPIRPVLQMASGPAVYLAMSLETAALLASLFFSWKFLQKPLSRVTPSRIKEMRLPTSNEISSATIGQIAQTVAAQVVITALVEMTFLQSDAPAQAICAVFLSGFLGALGAYLFNPVSGSQWYWIGPGIVGVIGYLLTFFSPSGLNIGEATGWTAALVRATPLQYAGAGTAGAILGFWCNRRWHQPEAEETTETQISGV